MKEVEAGLVIKTNPKEGKTVKEGAVIDIYQSIGKETISLSSYEGRDYSDVKSLLEKMGFKNISVTEKYDDSAAGTIIRTNRPRVPLRSYHPKRSLS